jgi:hypothetical protein
MSFWNLFYFTSGIYITQKYPNSVPNVKNKVDEITKLIISNNDFSLKEIIKIICEK